MTWSNAGWQSDEGGWYKNKAGSADAAQTTAFLARTSGLSGTETAAYKALINGLVSDGTFSLLDALYIFATNTTTTANLNLISTSFTLTKTGTVTFTADHGYAGDASTGFLDTGLDPTAAAGHYSLNSASLGAYSLTSRAVNAAKALIGDNSSGNFSYIVNLDGTGNIQYGSNGSGFPAVTNPAANGLGFYVQSRTGNTVNNIYRNGNTTSLATDTVAAGSMPSVNTFYICGINNAGTLLQATDDQISAAFIGGGLTNTQMNLISNRINGYMTALSINVY